MIKSVVQFTNDKNNEFKKCARYSITTNGSLITDDIIEFFDKHRFHVELSFDGKTQNYSRKGGSYNRIVDNLKKILKYKNIHLEINSVFTPSTVDLLFESIRFLLDQNVPDIRYSLSTIQPWNQRALRILELELSKLRNYLNTHYKENGSIPVVNFQENRKRGIFFCSAGQNRIAITPEGIIWGCHLFPDLYAGKENSKDLDEFSFGSLHNFKENYKKIYPKISAKYRELSMDNFHTSKIDCFLCSKIEDCSICPINAAFSSGKLGEIPEYLCAIQKQKAKVKLNF